MIEYIIVIWLAVLYGVILAQWDEFRYNGYHSATDLKDLVLHVLLLSTALALLFPLILLVNVVTYFWHKLTCTICYKHDQ